MKMKKGNFRTKKEATHFAMNLDSDMAITSIRGKKTFVKNADLGIMKTDGGFYSIVARKRR